MDLELAAHHALSLQGFGAMHTTTVLLDGPAADETADPWSIPDHANTVRTSATSGSGTGVSPVGNQPPPSQPAIDPTLPLLEDELLAELAAFSLHAWFDDPQRDVPPVILAPPQPSPIAAPASPPIAEPSASPADATNTSDSNTTATSGSGTGVSPVAAPTSASLSTGTLFVSASLASPTVASEPAITSMTLTRTVDWKGAGGTATAAVEVYNGTGAATAEGDYWVTFFVDRGIEGITLPEPTHAVPALAAGETSEASALATDVVFAPGAERDLYHLRAALVSHPKTPPREPAPLLVKAVSQLSVEWTRVEATGSGGVQAMGGGGGGVPHVDEVYLTPSSIWTEAGGTSQASANVCNNSGQPMGQQPQYTLTFSENADGLSIPSGQETHGVPQLDDGACGLVPPWGGVDVVVASGTDAGTYEVTATLSPAGGSNSGSLYVVEVTDWDAEWQPPWSPTWQAPDGTYPGPPQAEYLWSHDNIRWREVGANPANPPAITKVDWLAKDWNDWVVNGDGGQPWTIFASANTAQGETEAYGKPAPGDWAVTPEVHFEGQGTARLSPANMKRFGIAKINSLEWQAHGADPSLAGDVVPDGGNERFFPDAAMAGGAFRPRVDLHVLITPPEAGISVLMKAYDVDDPTDADGPIDVDPPDCAAPPLPGQTDINNNDNTLEGSIADGYTFPTSASTDDEGHILATLELTTFHPGRNYRVVAAHRLGEFDGVHALKDTGSGMMFQDLDADGCRDATEPPFDHTNPPAGIGVGPMLTVWRRVHVEIDSMSGLLPSEPNDETGSAIKGPVGTTTVMKTNGMLDDSVNRFEGGTYTDSNNNTFTVLENTDGQDYEVKLSTPQGSPTPADGDFVLKDDDARFSGKPDQALFNLFNAAFIVAAEIPSTTTSVQGQKNVENAEFEAQINLGKNLASSQAYWIAYVQGSFQGPQDKDYDPDPITEEGWQGGMTIMGQGALIHLEVIRDFAGLDPLVLERQVVVHEIGHQFDQLYEQDPVTGEWWHDTEGVMLPNSNGDTANSFFGEESQLRLRTSTKVNEQ